MRLSRLLVAAGLILAPHTLPSSAQAQQNGSDAPATSTLDLSLETGPARETGSARFYRRASALASRGGAMVYREPANQVVLGKLAIVSTAKVPIRAGRDSSSRLLSFAPQGTYLAIVSEVGEHYGVLMIDKTTGWVARSSVRLIDYQVAVGDPNTSAPTPPTTTTPSSAPDPTASFPRNLDQRKEALLREAFSYLGVPYVWAGNTRSGLDCSGFVKNVFATQGMSLPRHSGDQAKVGLPVAWEDLQAGDRLYFDMGRKGRISHTGIYLGNGYFIHASSNQKKVGVDSVLRPNYYRALVSARR
jgi:cell wall-associated NlpC family hydrolase